MESSTCFIASLIQNLTFLTFGQYIKCLPKKKVYFFYFHGVWRGECVISPKNSAVFGLGLHQKNYPNVGKLNQLHWVDLNTNDPVNMPGVTGVLGSLWENFGCYKCYNVPKVIWYMSSRKKNLTMSWESHGPPPPNASFRPWNKAIIFGLMKGWLILGGSSQDS